MRLLASDAFSRRFKLAVSQGVSGGVSAPCKGGDSQWVRIPPGNWSLQPVAIGAAVEVTKPSKPLV